MKEGSFYVQRSICHPNADNNSSKQVVGRNTYLESIIFVLFSAKKFDSKLVHSEIKDKSITFIFSSLINENYIIYRIWRYE
jgi:hypothetical protein